jgi:hypothetical protein
VVAVPAEVVVAAAVVAVVAAVVVVALPQPAATRPRSATTITNTDNNKVFLLIRLLLRSPQSYNACSLALLLTPPFPSVRDGNQA